MFSFRSMTKLDLTGRRHVHSFRGEPLRGRFEMVRRSSLRRFRECSEKSLSFFDLRKFRRRRKAFERGGEDVVGFERAAGRIELRQRQRRAQLERTRALFAGYGDGRLQIAAGVVWVGGRAEKPRLTANAEQLGLMPAEAARTDFGDELPEQGERLVNVAVSNLRLRREHPYDRGDELIMADLFQDRTRGAQLAGREWSAARH